MVKLEMLQAVEPAVWNLLVSRLPGAHVLQSWEWGQVKSRYGWQPYYLAWRDETGRLAAAAQVLQRSLPVAGFAARLRLLYVPKGPLLDWADAPLSRRVLEDLHAFARQQGAIFIKMDPDVCLGVGISGQPGAAEDPAGQALAGGMQAAGWRFSPEQIQFRNTVLVDLSPSEDELLANMKQKTRYNIRLAARKGVTVRTGGLADLPLLYCMYAETSVRDGFVIRDEGYYRAVWEAFMRPGSAPAAPQVPAVEPLIAEVEGDPVAAVMIFRFARKAWYLYGMSTTKHRDLMPNYLLQWEAMRRAKASGCLTYDLWGAPDEFDESYPMWGVFRFKEGLGGQVSRTLGAWDLPIRPTLYRLYAQTLPRLLDVMRRRGRASTARRVAGGI